MTRVSSTLGDSLELPGGFGSQDKTVCGVAAAVASLYGALSLVLTQHEYGRQRHAGKGCRVHPLHPSMNELERSEDPQRATPQEGVPPAIAWAACQVFWVKEIFLNCSYLKNHVSKRGDVAMGLK